MNKQLPWLISNVIEILDIEPESNEEEDFASIDLSA